MKTLQEQTVEFEFLVITNTLKKTEFNKSKAAELLGTDRKTIYNKIRKYREQHPDEFILPEMIEEDKGVEYTITE